MLINATVVNVAQETWFQGTKDERQVDMLNLIDRDFESGQTMQRAFVLHLPKEMGTTHAKSLLGKDVKIGVRDWKINKGGVLQAVGRILDGKSSASLPGTK